MGFWVDGFARADDKNKKEQVADTPVMFETLEPRILMSATPVVLLPSTPPATTTVEASSSRPAIVQETNGAQLSVSLHGQGAWQITDGPSGLQLTVTGTNANSQHQRFFRRYLRLTGMSGTVGESTGEFWAVYDLKVVRIPTHRPLRRRHLGTRLSATDAEKWKLVIERAQEMRRVGRPVLIGTRSVAASEQVSRLLSEAGLSHEVLNARQDKQEADIVAAAGQAGRITVATNMAGRGTDIKLDTEVIEAGGLHVILTEFHESARIDRQLFGRCARQGNPGTTEAIVSLQDELFLRFVAPRLQRLAGWMAANFRSGRMPRLLGGLLRWIGQRNAERLHSKTRRETVEQDKRFDRSLAFAGKSE